MSVCNFVQTISKHCHRFREQLKLWNKFSSISENEDMTENSGDSGFTEFNIQSKSQELDDGPSHSRSSSPPASSSSSNKKGNLKSDSLATCLQAPQQSTNNDSTDDDDSDDDDDDYNDSDGAKPDILQWVSCLMSQINWTFTNRQICH